MTKAIRFAVALFSLLLSSGHADATTNGAGSSGSKCRYSSKAKSRLVGNVDHHMSKTGDMGKSYEKIRTDTEMFHKSGIANNAKSISPDYDPHAYRSEMGDGKNPGFVNMISKYAYQDVSLFGKALKLHERYGDDPSKLQGLIKEYHIPPGSPVRKALLKYFKGGEESNLANFFSTNMKVRYGDEYKKSEDRLRDQSKKLDEALKKPKDNSNTANNLTDQQRKTLEALKKKYDEAADNVKEMNQRVSKLGDNFKDLGKMLKHCKIYKEDRKLLEDIKDEPQQPKSTPSGGESTFR